MTPTPGNTQPHAPAEPDEAEVVLALLSRQRDLYRELKQYSDQQAQLIASGDTEQLLSLLARRQSLVDELGQVAASLAPYRDRIAALADQADAAPPSSAKPGRGTQLRGLIEEVRVLLESIIASDEQGQADLAMSRDQVGAQIRKAAGAAAAAGAYGGAAAAGPRFTQQEG